MQSSISGVSVDLAQMVTSLSVSSTESRDTHTKGSNKSKNCNKSFLNYLECCLQRVLERRGQLQCIPATCTEFCRITSHRETLRGDAAHMDAPGHLGSVGGQRGREDRRGECEGGKLLFACTPLSCLQMNSSTSSI